MVPLRLLIRNLGKRPNEMSPFPDETQPYTSVNTNTAEAAAQRVVHLNLSRFDAIQVPRVWTLSLAITENPAKQNPTTVKSSNICVVLVSILRLRDEASEIFGAANVELNSDSCKVRY